MNIERFMKSCFFICCFLTLLIFPLNVQAGKYPVTWNPTSITETLGLGGTKDLSTSFTSATKLNNVDLWVVPELQPFVSVEPNHFNTVEKNVSYPVTVHISVPIETEGIFYEGNIHLRVNSQTYPQTLKVTLNIVNLMYEAVPPTDPIPEIITIPYTTDDGYTFDMDIVSGHVIVQFSSDVPELIAEELLINDGANIIAKIPAIGYYLVNVDDEMTFIDRMRLEPTVIYAQPDFLIGPRETPDEWDSIPKGDSKRSVLDTIKAPEAWSSLLKDSTLILRGIEIGVVDQSFECLSDGMTDFEGRISIDDVSYPGLILTKHGSQTLATGCATGNNGFGNVGVNWWSLIRVADIAWPSLLHPSQYFSTLSRRDYQMTNLINKGSKIINLSVGYTGNQDLSCSPEELKEYKEDYKHLFGTVEQIRKKKSEFLVVLAAGNDPCELDRDDFIKPDNVIVASVNGLLGCNSADPGSVKGSIVDIATPDGLVWYDYCEKAYGESLIGTSFAAPLVTGAAALVWAKEPTLTSQQVVQRLKDTANKCVDKKGINDFGGAGILDAYGALNPQHSESFEDINCVLFPFPPGNGMCPLNVPYHFPSGLILDRALGDSGQDIVIGDFSKGPSLWGMCQYPNIDDPSDLPDGTAYLGLNWGAIITMSFSFGAHKVGIYVTSGRDDMYNVVDHVIIEYFNNTSKIGERSLYTGPLPFKLVEYVSDVPITSVTIRGDGNNPIAVDKVTFEI